MQPRSPRYWEGRPLSRQPVRLGLSVLGYVDRLGASADPPTSADSGPLGKRPTSPYAGALNPTMAEFSHSRTLGAAIVSEKGDLEASRTYSGPVSPR
ncbi:hypothetical protein VTH82DRAFT_8652 [Thermothelomyces myriococcoides]